MSSITLKNPGGAANNAGAAAAVPISTVFTIPSSPPSTCRTIISAATTSPIHAFLARFNLGSASTNLNWQLQAFYNAIQKADQSEQIDYSTGDGKTLNENLSAVENRILPTLELANSCLTENAQIDMTSYNAAKAKAAKSSARLLAIQTPETHLSYYTWFPIIRPMTETALFVIFGFAILLFIVSILIFLRMQGVFIELHIPETSIGSMEGFTLPPNAIYYVNAGLLVGLIVAYFTVNNRKA
jgi:hypothetical protein